MQKIKSLVYVGGGRHHKCEKVIAQITDLIFSRRAHMVVGCATGADEMFIKSAIKRQRIRSTVINTVFQQNGNGAIESSAVETVSLAFRAGGAVNFCAGGPVEEWVGEKLVKRSVAGRLMGRSVAGLVGAACAIFVSPGSGSYKVMAQAVLKNVPVYVFGEQLPKQLSVPGHWVPSNLHGFKCWQFLSSKKYQP